MNLKILFFYLSTAACLLHGADTELNYDFEKGSGKQLPPYSVHVKGKDEGGTIEVVKDPIGTFTKALKMTSEPAKPDVRFLIRKKFTASTGDILCCEAMVKGNGIACFGFYGYDKKGNMKAYAAVKAKVNSKTWVKLSKEIPVKDNGVAYVYPFLQCNGGEVLFSGLKITLKGIPNGLWEHQQGARELNWKKNSELGTLQRAEQKGNSFLLRLSSAKDPMQIAAEKFAGKAGDLVTVSFKAKGKGSLSPVFLLYDKSGKSELKTSQQIVLSSEFRKYSCDIRVTNASAFETAMIRPVFRLSADGRAEIDEISFFWQNSRFSGDLPFAATAVVFPLMDAKLQLSQAQLKTIPTILNGKKGIHAQLNSATLDLAPFMNGVKAKNCAWVFFKLNSPINCKYTLGAGADWWMTVYLNGKPVIDTMSSGNTASQCDVTNHIADVRLKKGENIIAVKFLSGQNSSILRIGGPDAIRMYSAILIRNRELAIDNYQDRSVKRPGSPDFKEMIARNGDMSKTLAGVYSKSTKITPFQQKFSCSQLNTDEMLGQNILLLDFPFISKQKNQFSFICSTNSQQMRCTVESKDSDHLFCYFSVDGKRVSPEFRVPNARRILPIEVTLYSEPNGHCCVIFGSTSKTTAHFVFHWTVPAFQKMAKEPLAVCGEIVLAGKDAKMIIDDYTVLTGKEKVERSRMPFLLDLSPEFDPVKAGWKQIVSDDFSGTQVNEKIWRVEPQLRHLVKLDGKGHLILTTDWDKAHKKLICGRVQTHNAFTYGYYEARLKFTKQPGSWSAFWMMAPWTPCSPFYSVEWDFYEDYYTRPTGPGMPYRKTLDSTAYTGWRHGYKRPIKIWNYQSELPGTLDEFYTFGVKWTPFEISYYLNGKQLRGSLKFSPYQTVTWDAFNHCTVNCQEIMILSSQTGIGNPLQGKYPEDFVVDHFRAFEYPMDNAPQIKWVDAGKPENLFIRKGTTLNLKVEAKPGKSGAKIRGVYLFDNGYYIARKEAPPYAFSIPMTDEFYKTTQYAVPGVSKGTVMNPPDFNTSFPHSFRVYVQDEKGKINWTSMKKYVLKSDKESTPYQGKAAVIPGTLTLNLFDAGGQDVAYYWSAPGGRDQNFRMDEKVYACKDVIESNQPCNWAKYTVDVKEAGKYDAELTYMCWVKGKNVKSKVELYVDGFYAGRFDLFNSASFYAPRRQATLRGIRLPAGRHQLLLMFTMGGVCSQVKFIKAQ